MAITNQQILNLGLDPEELTEIQLDYIEESIDTYNDLYDTNYNLENIPDVVLEFAVLNSLMTINGWQDSYTDDYSQEVIDLIQRQYGEDYQDYDGITSTNKELLKDYESPEEIPDEFINDRSEVVSSGLFAVYQLTQKQLATNDNRSFVGVITRRDDRVRATHRPNDNKYWPVNSRRDFSADFNCRCTYLYFKSEEEAIEAGFSSFSGSSISPTPPVSEEVTSQNNTVANQNSNTSSNTPPEVVQVNNDGSVLYDPNKVKNKYKIPGSENTINVSDFNTSKIAKISNKDGLLDIVNESKIKTKKFNLTKNQEIFLQDYTKGGYKQVNSLLRSGKSNFSDVKQLENIIKKSPALDSKTTIYRGLDKNFAKTLNITNLEDTAQLKKLKNTIFTDKGFSSTSFDPTSAKNFIDQGGVFIKINAKKGTKGINVNNSLTNPGFAFEEEFILPRNSKFKIINVGREKMPGSNIYYNIYLEVDLL